MNTLSFPLRSGETCSLSQDTLTVGQRQIPLRDIVSAGLVADNSVPAAPGMPPTPGVALQLGDGGRRRLHPCGATRLLAAAPVALRRGATAQRAAAAPAWSAGRRHWRDGRPWLPMAHPPPYGYAPPYGYGYAPVGPSESDRTLAGICHLSVFFAPIILPLIIWLAMRRTHSYASSQAKQAFFFHLFFTIIAFVGLIVLQFFFF